ncbi:MAG: hypothetical protein A2234_02885 [Elusimicrobia bacterium RIFOXYA2_FULL_58_8]|nr:MAG: hypothetical protein A2234_02885 [Elusimicrobia bacterium RIFOXYA2_FULL_58_8]OGS14443.1 MAG: hypothetical protein A2285_07975 [Elusimicrobia bacterium RIFOXYA12_FULL_57_11]
MKKLLLLLLPFFLLPDCAAAEKIRIGYPSAGSLISGQIGAILERTDILERNGLEGEVTPFLYGPPMQEALLAGHIDVALTSEANFVNLAAKFPCKMIATLGSAGRIAIMVRNDSPIKSVADLRGKTLATVFGTSAHYPAVQWLLKAGLDPAKDVKLLHMAAAEGRAALIKGDIDAITMWDPFVEDFIQKKAARVLQHNPSFWTTTVASEEFLKNKPDTVVNFLLALHEASLFLALNKELANGWLSKTMNVSPAVIDKGSSYNSNYARAKKLKDISIVPGKELLERLKQIANFNLASGLLKEKSPVKEKTDLSFAKAAAKKANEFKSGPATVRIKDK